MATYPANIGQNSATRITPQVGTEIDQAWNGTIHIRKVHDATVYEIQSVHVAITDSEKNSIVALYDNDPIQVITWTYQANSDQYSCYFRSRPLVTRVLGGYWTVVSSLIGIKL